MGDRGAVDLINEYFGTDYQTRDEISDRELLKMLIACILAAEETFKGHERFCKGGSDG